MLIKGMVSDIVDNLGNAVRYTFSSNISRSDHRYDMYNVYSIRVFVLNQHK